MSRNSTEALAWAKAQDARASQDWHNLCLSFVRQSFGFDYVGHWPNSDRFAGMAWQRAKEKHKTTDSGSIPAGVPIFWNSPSRFEHIALSAGGGRCYSTDVPRGQVGLISIDELTRAWNMQLLGWTGDLVGNDIDRGGKKEPVGLPVHGVDISHHQGDGKLGYKAAMRAGVRWMYHKATEGATWRDKNYGLRRAEANKVGLPFGAYHFARPEKNDVRDEAMAFLAYAAPEPGDLGACLDLETTEGMSMRELDEWAVAWGRFVKEATGGPLVLYTPFALPKAEKFFDVIWRPRYNDDNRPPELFHQIHQFSNGDLGVPNKVAGFGHVDLNQMKRGLKRKDLLIPVPEEVEPPKPPRRKRNELHLQQASMQWADTPAEAREDFDEILSRKAHAVGFTEIYGDLGRLERAAEKHGYEVVWGPTKNGKAETVVAVRKDLPIKDYGSVLVNPGQKGKAPSKGHSSRYATWVTFEFEGDEVTVIEGHWVTKAKGDQDRLDKREEMSFVVTELAEKKGKGAKLCFVFGDTNEDDKEDNTGSEVYDPMEESLDTIFDELQEWPPTHRGKHKATIDIILSYTRDKRVRAERVKVWRDGNSDHFQVSGFYSILERKAAA